ncbi:hypothetical protein vseg_003434 [Gypsophila vaccaria]
MTGNDAKNVPSFQPAFSVSSIKNHVHVILDMDNVHYSLLSELFINTAAAYEINDHLVDPPDATPSRTTTDKALWKSLDAIVKQWIYATISTELLQTVVETGSTAKDTWNRINKIFQDNINARAVFLEQQFSGTKQEEFYNVSAYYQALKVLAHKLTNVGSKVTDDRLVLQLVTGLSDSYAKIATIIQHSDHLPPFYKARSMLVLEETRQNNASSSRESALVAHHDPSDTAQNDSPTLFTTPTTTIGTTLVAAVTTTAVIMNEAGRTGVGLTVVVVASKVEVGVDHQVWPRRIGIPWVNGLGSHIAPQTGCILDPSSFPISNAWVVSSITSGPYHPWTQAATSLCRATATQQP